MEGAGNEPPPRLSARQAVAVRRCCSRPCLRFRRQSLSFALSKMRILSTLSALFIISALVEASEPTKKGADLQGTWKGVEVWDAGEKRTDEPAKLLQMRFRGDQFVVRYDGKIMLSPKENLAVGFCQEMTQESERKPRARKVEVTITAEMDAKYAVGDAIVLGDDGS